MWSRSSAASSAWPWLFRQCGTVNKYQCLPLKVSKVFDTQLLVMTQWDSALSLHNGSSSDIRRMLPGEIDPTLAGGWCCLRAREIEAFCFCCQVHVQALCLRNCKAGVQNLLLFIACSKQTTSILLQFKTLYLFFRHISLVIFMAIRGIAVCGDA